MKRFLAILMSVVLVVGLVPMAPYGELQAAWAGDALTASSAPDVLNGGEYAEPVGLQLNDRPFSLANYGVASNDYRACILPSDLEKGGVAFSFRGKAPRLIVAAADYTVLVRIVATSETTYRATVSRDGEEVTLGEWSCDDDSPALTWKDEAKTTGVEFFPADVIREALERAGRQLSDVGRVYPQANGGDVTVNRVVLTRTDLLPDVSNRGYGTDEVRRVYTRPVTITTAPDAGDRVFRTCAIDIMNPVFDGADLAVRYTCPEGKEAVPALQLCYVTPDPEKPGANKWAGWTKMTNAATWGVRTAVDAETGERVTFFDRAELERVWRENGGKDGNAFDYLYVTVHTENGAYPSGSEQCDLIEIVAIGGEKRIELSAAQKNKVHGKTVQEIAQDMRAGYNMAGHFDANYVPDSSKDGGWGQSDLALEAHWTRGTYITRQNIRALKQKGFNAIRLPITWFQHIYPAGDPTGSPADHPEMTPTDRYRIDRAWLERVHEVVDWCIAEDLYVIVNIHHEDWIDREDLDTAYDATDLPVKFNAVWSQIAAELSGYDQRLVFEDMNEPHMWYYEKAGDGSYKLDAKGNRIKNWGYATEGSVATVNRLNADFVNLMRAMPAASGHPDRLLMMAHDTGDGEISTTGFVMPDDPKELLAHSLHCYAPHAWTHYFANGNHEGETGELNVYSDSYRAEVESKWESYRMNYIAKGEQIILGEFGCYYLGDSAERKQDRLDWMQQYATHAKELGIPMFYWRMDKTKEDASGKEYVEWSAFNEQTGDYSELSRQMLEEWFNRANDESIRWGSYANIEEGEIPSIESGVQIGHGSSEALPATIKGNHSGTSKEWRLILSGISWDDLVGNEVAVKFSGNAPRLGAAIQESSKGDYWGAAADVVDYANGIAYFRASSIKTRWLAVIEANANKAGADREEKLLGKTENDIYRLCICTATSGSSTPMDDALSTTIEQVAIVHRHEWGPWQQATAPTCVEQGMEERVCAVDGSHVLSRPLPSLGGHVWESSYTVDVEPSLAGPGSKSIHCTRCGARKNETPIAALTAIDATIDLRGATITLDKASYTWNGKAKTPSVRVVYRGATLRPNVDYTVSYSENTNVGTAKVTVNGAGLYGNSASVEFRINPKGTRLKKLTPAKKGFTAKWAKQARQVGGYQLQYARSKSFKGAKTVKVSKANATKKAVSKLKSKKKYYVRVRTYKRVLGKTYCSSWSATKSVKTRR